MYERSLAFDEAIKSSHAPRCVADLYQEDQLLIAGLPVLGGVVEVDGSATISRRRCELSLVDVNGTITPNSGFDSLAPYGREIRIRKGIQFSSGLIEYLPLGVFRIQAVSVDHSSSSRAIKVSGYDRARTVSRFRFEVPYVVVAGTNYATAITDLLQSRLANLSTSFISTLAVTPLLVFDQGSDPWEAATKMAESIGCELFFDPNGVAVMRPPTNPDAVAVDWEYEYGNNATVLSVDNTMTDEPGYNGVVVDGEPSDAPPVHAVRYDVDPDSPANSNGSYNKVPRFYRSTYITSQAQADAAAESLLLNETGGTEELRYTCIPHPAHEVGDLVSLVDPMLGVDGVYLLEQFSMPLDLDVMAATTRKRRTV